MTDEGHDDGQSASDNGSDGAGETQDDLPDDLRSYARQLAENRGRPLFVWCEPERSIGAWAPILLRRALFNRPRIPELDLLIYSPGGDIHAAYQALRILRQHATYISALIPAEAKSAATFLALGCDEILFGEDGELGPLDTQVLDPRGTRWWGSALNQFKSMEFIREYSMITLAELTSLMLEYDMDVPYALQHAEGTIGAFTTPLFSQVRPEELGGYRMALQLVEDYSRRVMERWGYHDRGRAQIQRMVQRLVWDYPSHGFVIDLDEAREIGLNAQEMPFYDDILCRLLVRTGETAFEGINLPPARHSATVDGTDQEAQADDTVEGQQEESGDERAQDLNPRERRARSPQPEREPDSQEPRDGPPGNGERPQELHRA